jgi:acyl-CoA synthetase (NDP forming)
MRILDRNNLKPFFEPESVAVFGSLRDGMGLGYGTIRNMLDFGFKGRIYPVNPNYNEVLGLKVYASVGEVAGPVALAVVITPAPTVPEIIDQCAQKGVEAAVIVSEHFAEAGEEGARLQQQLVETARRTGIRIMGPNTIGTLNTANGLVTTPYLLGYKSIQKGGIAYCSQSGIVAAQCQPLEDRAYPISKMCDLANKCDVNEVDVLEYLADDPETKVVAMHIEDVRDGHGFMSAARKLTARKPLLIFRTARSEAGARASASHTGSLAGDDDVYNSAFKQVGAVRLRTWQEFWEIPRIFAPQRPIRGNRLAVIAYSGGAGVVAADAAAEAGLALADFTSITLDRLRLIDPRAARNPVDLGPVLSAAADTAYVQDEAITAILEDDNVDCAGIALYVGVLAPENYVVELLERLIGNTPKPVTIWLYGTQLYMLEETSRRLEVRGLPTFTELETAVKALGVLAEYSGFRSSLVHDAA